MFIAHDIAGWIGVPVGIVIAALIILRKKGMALRARRKQARAGSPPATGQAGSQSSSGPAGSPSWPGPRS